MKLILNDRNADVCKMFAEVLKYIPISDIHCCNFEDIPRNDYDILLTPGNSYGQMTGGFDLAVRNRWPESEGDVQRAIRRHHNGMCPIGDSVTVALSTETSQVLIYTPTMRVPMPIHGTDNVYWAYRKAFNVIEMLEHGTSFPRAVIRDLRVLLPAFGTSAGYMPYIKAANQCRLAWEHTFRPPIQATTAQMFADHKQISEWM